MTHETVDRGLLERAQHRIETSRAGKVVVSLVAVALVGAVFMSSFLQGEARLSAMARYGPPINALGLDQQWNVFAPKPRGVALGLYGVITFEDGARQRWEMPDGDPFIGAYRIYRWRKWMEYARADDRAGQLFEPTARWLARTFSTPERRVVKVDLVRRWYDIPPPGGETPEWNEYTYYTLDVLEDPGEDAP